MPAPNADSPAHWSKDFVEHLRAVHFALIAISAGLILLMLSSREYNAVLALVQIEAIIEFKHQWSLQWIRDNAIWHPNHYKRHVDGNEPVNKFSRLLSLAIDIPERGPLNARLFEWTPKKPDYTLGELARPVVYSCDFQENWITNSKWSPNLFPRTLKEFRIWWSAFATPQVLKMPTTIYEGTVFNSPEPPRGPLAFVFIPIKRDDEKLLPHYDISFSLANFDEPAYVFEQDASSPDVGDFGSVVLSANDVREYEVSQQTISSVFTNMQPSGSFAESFTDLSTAARNFADLSLEDIEKFLHDEAGKGQDVFEAFGMKFPASRVTLWGQILLLSVQLYFFIYLRQLSGKLRADDPGWDVPWAGMDMSHVGQAVMIFTLIVLPISAVALLDFQAVRGKLLFSNGPYDFWMPSLAYTGLVLALGASGFLGILSWRYRPSVKPEEPPVVSPWFY
jgi:hypothetical protein